MHADRHTVDLPLDSEFVDLAAEIFGLLADPTRIRIIIALSQNTELPVNALAEAVGKNPSGVSQHLARLRMARLVSTRQDGNRVMYQLVDNHSVSLVVEAINQAEHTIEQGHTPPHHHR